MERDRFSRRAGARRAARILFLAGAFVMLATVTRPGPEPPPAPAVLATLRAEPVALDPEEPARRRAGRLLFLAGWRLSSDEPRFGGISAMHVGGGQIVAISDAGTLLRFPVPRRSGTAPLHIDPLPFGPGAAVRKSNRDSEAMLVAGDSAWIAFERHNRVRRYRVAGWTQEGEAHPALMRDWGRNSGAEAMVRLADGRFLLFAEGGDGGAPFSEAVLFQGDPADPATPSARLRYRRPAGYRITDAAVLPDGRLLLLNRRFTLFGWFSAKVAVADTRRLGPGATIAAREVAELRSPLTVDNMEALSVTREGGRTIVWIASDDNFNRLQRTLLLKFALIE